MNKIKRPVLSLILAATLTLLPAAALAAPGGPKSAAPGSTLAQRIAQRKSERKLKLNQESLQRLTGNCVNVQGNLRQIHDDAVGIFNNRAKVYQTVDARVWVAIGQLKLANQDTFKLEQQHQSLVSNVARSQVLINNYEQALDDATLLNCQADPTGFQALVDTARIYYQQIRSQETNNENYIVNTIKPTISSFVNILQPPDNSASGGN